MRRKLVIAAGLIVALVGGTFLMDWRFRAYNPPLRKGMTEEEVTQLLGKAESTIGNQRMRSDAYPQGPDFFGNRKMILVNIAADGHVLSWHIESLRRGSPWWLGGKFYD
jgi:hypothetical protein